VRYGCTGENTSDLCGVRCFTGDKSQGRIDDGEIVQSSVREYWLVDPDAKFTEVFRHDGNKFDRQGVFKPSQPFVSAVLGGATIDSGWWYGE